MIWFPDIKQGKHSVSRSGASPSMVLRRVKTAMRMTQKEPCVGLRGGVETAASSCVSEDMSVLPGDLVVCPQVPAWSPLCFLCDPQV